MRYSKLFGKTQKTAPSEAKFASHKLLYQAGFIRESTAGRFYLLPLGMKVSQKIIKVIKEEMDRSGAQEMVTPVLHPLALWKETNRTKTTGFELMKITDRNKQDFVLGGTAEEMFVDVVRRMKLTYRDLPINLYQFSAKFRDELRPRGGLLRVREFTMKDAYSFDQNEEEFKKTYELMRQTYERIFKRLGLNTSIIEADNGYIGGEYCHEFVVESEIGESNYFKCSCTYAAHFDVALSEFTAYSQDENLKSLKPILGKGVIGVKELADYLNIPVQQTTKTLIFKADEKIVAAMIRGDFDINETKLKNYLRCTNIELADRETVIRITGAKVGYAGPINLPKDVKLVADLSTKGRVNFEAGANKTDYHYLNVNFERDFPMPAFTDIRTVNEGDTCQKCRKGKLKKGKGIEVGNIFQLGYHYSKLMAGADFTDRDGTLKKYYMGCYGIGIGRTLAAIVEKYHDEKGIIWPDKVAPYSVYLIGLFDSEGQVKKQADDIYELLQKQGIEVLYDDRNNVSAGVKFADCDLLGIPYRLVISKKTSGKVEIKKRNNNEVSLIYLDENNCHTFFAGL